MSKFQELVDLCKGGVFVFANDHRSNYESTADFINSPDNKDDLSDTPKEVIDMMLAVDRVYRIQAYVFTPIGFEMVYHYDFDKAVEEVLKLVKKHTEKKS